jgi:type I site-specific restriction endonuclease
MGLIRERHPQAHAGDTAKLLQDTGAMVRVYRGGGRDHPSIYVLNRKDFYQEDNGDHVNYTQVDSFRKTAGERRDQQLRSVNNSLSRNSDLVTRVIEELTELRKRMDWYDQQLRHLTGAVVELARKEREREEAANPNLKEPAFDAQAALRGLVTLPEEPSDGE